MSAAYGGLRKGSLMMYTCCAKFPVPLVKSKSFIKTRNTMGLSETKQEFK